MKLAADSLIFCERSADRGVTCSQPSHRRRRHGVGVPAEAREAGQPQMRATGGAASRESAARIPSRHRALTTNPIRTKGIAEMPAAW